MESALLTWSPVEGASSYRLMVYDRTDAQTLLDETVVGAAYQMKIPDARRNHELVMRTRPLVGAEWVDWTEFQPLPVEIVLGERRKSGQRLSKHDRPSLLFMFTVDTECWIERQPNPDPGRVVDEQIFGDFGNGAAPGGIGLHMDLLEHFGFRGTFFVDVLLEFEHGRDALERTIAAIAERGHEVELHVHPEHLEWSTDRRAASVAKELSTAGGMRNADIIRRVLELSVDLFERRVGRRPLAYRAGGFRISDEHFPVLEEFGIRIDSSVQPYYNARVSDWMRTRTQPFHVGDVLEIPPTFVLLNDRPDVWETRGLAPSFGLGDPVSALPARPGEPPFVATLVSHSFQLLRCRNSRERDAIESFEERLRSRLPAETAERLLQDRPKAVRTFGPEIDDGSVAHVATRLRRVADRTDARCVTYAEVAGSAERFWPTQRQPQVDRIALLDRRRGVTAITGTRIFSEGLLAHLISTRSPAPTPSPDPDPRCIRHAEHGGLNQLARELDSAAAKHGAKRPLHVRIRPLGIVEASRHGMLPPLAEVLFPAVVVRAIAGEAGADLGESVPWDVPTFRAWLEMRGFEIVGERRIPRGREEMEALDRFGEKLRHLDPVELSTEAWEVELRCTGSTGSELPEPPPHRPLFEWQDGTPPLARVEAGVAPQLLPVLAADLYESIQPGHEVQLGLAGAPGVVSRTTLLLAMLRAGFEVLDGSEGVYRLLRPVDLPDILRFAGVSP